MRKIQDVLNITYQPITTLTFATGPGTLELKDRPKSKATTTTTKQAPGERVQEALEILRPLWEDLRNDWLRNKWGIKTECVQLVWPANRYEGSFAEWIEKTVDILEDEYVAELELRRGE